MKPHHVLPLSWRVQLRVWWRKFQDWRRGTSFAIARTLRLQPVIVHPQRIMPSKTYAEKEHNLRLAAERISRLVLMPGEVFSFWWAVGPPTAKQGYRSSRSLVNGKLVPTEGGGLCQLSGLLYQLALQAGLEIKERHAHSIDIYTDETRFTPLGSDATVVYVLRDLRFRNPHPVPIQFACEFSPGQITAMLYAAASIPVTVIDYVQVAQSPLKVVETRNQQGKVLAISRYPET